MLYIWLFCLPVLCIGQESINEVRSDFSEIIYDIKESTPSISYLDNIINAYQSFGDKELIRQMIVEGLIFTDKDQSYRTSSALEIPLSKKDSIYLSSLPKLSSSIRKIPYSVFVFTVMGKSLNEQSEFLEAYFEIMSQKEKLFPHMNTGNSRLANRYEEELNNHSLFLTFAVEHPNEMNELVNLFKEQCLKWRKSYTPANITKFQAHLTQTFDKNSIYAYFIPNGISFCLEQLNMPESIIPSYQDMRSNSQEFIYNAFNDVLHREPSQNELIELKSYIDKTEDIRPEMIYYALILIKYE